jgi:hypothetical protein
VFALAAIEQGETLNFSLRRVEDILHPQAPFGEAVHGAVVKAFAPLGDAGHRALGRLRSNFSFSEKYQTFPFRGGFDDVYTLGLIRHSNTPNIARKASAPGKMALFEATRDIQSGEELTMHHGVDATIEIEGSGGVRAFYEWKVERKDPPWVRAAAGQRARGGIDYSKWDDVGSSSESD